MFQIKYNIISYRVHIQWICHRYLDQLKQYFPVNVKDERMNLEKFSTIIITVEDSPTEMKI